MSLATGVQDTCRTVTADVSGNSNRSFWRCQNEEMAAFARTTDAFYDRWGTGNISPFLANHCINHRDWWGFSAIVTEGLLYPTSIIVSFVIPKSNIVCFDITLGRWVCLWGEVCIFFMNVFGWDIESLNHGGQPLWSTFVINHWERHVITSENCRCTPMDISTIAIRTQTVQWLGFSSVEPDRSAFFWA